MSTMRAQPAPDWRLEQGRLLWSEDDTPEGFAMRVRVSALPEPHRSCVELRMWGRHTFKEIARMLGMSGRQNAHDHYKRAVEWLRLDMENDVRSLASILETDVVTSEATALMQSELEGADEITPVELLGVLDAYVTASISFLVGLTLDVAEQVGALPEGRDVADEQAQASLEFLKTLAVYRVVEAKAAIEVEG